MLLTVGWYSVYDLPPLAFDHAKIVDYTLNRLRGKLGLYDHCL